MTRNWEDLPKPDRNGWAGIVVALSVLFSVVIPQGGLECWFNGGPQTETVQQIVERETLTWTPSDSNGTGKDNACHLDAKDSLGLHHIALTQYNYAFGRGEWHLAVCPTIPNVTCSGLVVAGPSNTGRIYESPPNESVFYRWHCPSEINGSPDGYSIP